ncbi:MAG: polysaccharide synthesis protein GtrA [Flavisolibacter sp.]|jgi:putative flippase GtrA|nr:polysaccharide synthesis protein GtrA [Flavisolibacter sp.]
MKKLLTNTITLVHSRKELLTEAGKYFVVGGLCTVLDFAILFVLTEYFKVQPLSASVISFMSGALLNYYLCTFWIFKVRSVSNRHLEMTYYILITAVGLGINFLLILFFTSYQHYHVMLSKLLATFVTYWWNFGARKYFLHTKTTLQTEVVKAAE